MICRVLRWASLALALCLCAPASTTAQPLREADAVGVLTLDLERLFEESSYGLRVSREIETQGTALAAENRRIEAELTEEERNLTEQRETLPVEEFRVLADAFDAKVDRIRAEQDGKTREVQRIGEVERQRFFRLIGPILSALARERRAAVILDRRSVFIAVDSVDITDEAVKRIDADIGDGAPADN